MNRHLSWTKRWNWRPAGVGCALLLGGAAVLAQEASAPAPVAARVPAPVAPTPTFTAFQIIGNYNIFNANRIGYEPGAATVHIDTIALVGTMSYDGNRLALFDSPDRTFRKGVKEGDKIAEFTVTKITTAGVQLTRDSKMISMAMGQELRRPPGGTWTLGFVRRGDPAAAEAAAAAAAAPAIPADASDILRQLMEQRQEQLKQ
jgi:hypothetical protein